MSGMFNMAGQVASAKMQADAIKDTAKMQIKALKEAQQFIYEELEPTKVGAQATAADVQRAKQQLALQGIIDPALLKARYASEQKLLEAIQQAGAAPADEIAALAVEQARGLAPGIEDVKTRMIDQALDELSLGATLPPDLQAELVQAGLQRGSQIGAGVSSRGLAGEATRKLIGERGLALQAERQQRAASLAQTAQALEQNRLQALTSLFPNLQAQQLANIQVATSGLPMSAAEVPEAGLSGQNIANIWLSRVGATGALAAQQADIGAQQMSELGKVYSGMIGGLSKGAGQMASSLGDWRTATQAAQTAGTPAPGIWGLLLS